MIPAVHLSRYVGIPLRRSESMLLRSTTVEVAKQPRVLGDEGMYLEVVIGVSWNNLLSVGPVEAIL